MDIKKIALELIDGAEFKKHSSGGRLLRKGSGYLKDTFLSTKLVFAVKAGAFLLVSAGALGLLWWNWDWFKSMAVFAWEGLCSLYETASGYCSSALDTAWYWLGLDEGSHQPA